MMKTMVTVARREGVSHDELVKVWEEVHIPHVRKVLAPLRYKVTFFHDNDTWPLPDFDGMAELWFRDEQHRLDGIGREDIGADGFGQYIDPEKVLWYPVTEYVNVDGAVSRETVKLVYYVKRRQGIERDAFHQTWLDVHRPNVAGAVNRSPAGLRYTISLVTSAADLAYDGVAQIWMAGASPTIGDLAIDPDAFSDQVGLLHGCKSHEIVVVP